MSEKHDADNPYIGVAENANPKAFSIVFFGAPTLILLLALMFPFFRHIFTFGTVALTAICIAAVMMAYMDKENGVIRQRPDRKGFAFPKWFRPAFFLLMIFGSAGLRLGWYFIPLCWVLNWVCLTSFRIYLEATYEKKALDVKQTDISHD